MPFSRFTGAAAAVVFPLLASCTAPTSAPSGESAPPSLTADDSVDPAVVLLASYPADRSVLDTCTAVLVAPSVLLTAAHCVDAKGHEGHRFGVYPGADASAYGDAAALAPMLVEVSEVHAHPDYDPSPPFHADIGIVVLKEPLAAAPLPLNRAPLTRQIEGKAARIVGYGQLVYGEYNALKHGSTTRVAELDPADTVVVGDADHRSCVGDSGGPALVTIDGVETVIGVDSYTDSTGCLEPAHYQRTDAYAAFIDAYVPLPGADGAGSRGGRK